jgi:hypothetical protein
MMTRHIGPRRGKSSHRRGDGLPTPIPPGFDDRLIAKEACPYCQRDLMAYRFITGDGLPIITYHCAEHGDVIPMHGVIVHDE